MFEASVSVTVRKTVNGNTIQSQIMTAAPTVEDLMIMLGSMLMSNTDILMTDIERQLPKLEAETIKAESVPVPVFDAPAAAAEMMTEVAKPKKKKSQGQPWSEVKIDEPAAPAEDKQ